MLGRKTCHPLGCQLITFFEQEMRLESRVVEDPLEDSDVRLNASFIPQVKARSPSFSPSVGLFNVGQREGIYTKAPASSNQEAEGTCLLWEITEGVGQEGTEGVELPLPRGIKTSFC